MTMLTKDKSKEIIFAIKNGKDSQALNLLYKSTLPHIIKFISQNNGDEEEAKDIFQDAVISLFTTIKLGKYDEEKEVGAFLYFVSRNLWINRVKKRNRQLDITNSKSESTEEGPLAVILTEEKQNAIDKLMDKAGAKCKELLKYVLYDNLSMKEIAILMGFGGETVAKTTHYRCKQKLIEIVEKNKDLVNLFKG